MKNLLLFTVFLVFISSCSKNIIVGSGNVISEDRINAPFNKIKSSSSIDIFVSYGASQSITITTDDNIIDRITTNVHNHTLVIGIKPGNISSKNIKAYIEIPNLAGISLTGSGDTEISDFKTLKNLEINNTGSADIEIYDYPNMDVFKIRNTGSGNIEATGNVNYYKISNTGSGNLHTFNLIANTCDIRNTGSGDIEVNSKDSLNIYNTGSGDVFYKGFPKLNAKNTGSGYIKRVD